MLKSNAAHRACFDHLLIANACNTKIDIIHHPHVPHRFLKRLSQFLSQSVNHLSQITSMSIMTARARSRLRQESYSNPPPFLYNFQSCRENASIPFPEGHTQNLIPSLTETARFHEQLICPSQWRGSTYCPLLKPGPSPSQTFTLLSLILSSAAQNGSHRFWTSCFKNRRSKNKRYS